MSAPERFQVGDTVRCAAHHEPHTVTMVQPDSGDVCVDDDYVYFPATLFTLARPTPSALDPFAWNSEVLWTASGPLAGCVNSTIAAWVAWSRFCCWTAQSNLAAHFLPTVAAARTRASNGRDVPPATVLVELPVDVVEWWARSTYHFYVDRNQRMAAACRRAMGGGA